MVGWYHTRAALPKMRDRSLMATTFVDVTYRGLKVQEKAKLVEDEAATFLESEVPLPVGTTLALVGEAGPPRAARVVAVVEHEAGAQGQPAGMRLLWGEAVVTPPVVIPVPEPPPPAPEPAAEPVEVSADVSGDSSSAGDPDASSDGSNGTPAPGGNGAPSGGKKSKKNKKRR
jgi:hypothetical protein